MTPAAKRNTPEEVLDIFGKYNALPYHGEADDIGHYLGNPSIPDIQDCMTQV